MKLNFAELTDIGLVRKANEDSVGHLSVKQTNGYGNVFIVCDGMGGHVGGARASQKAVESIKEYFSNEPNANPQIALKEAVEFSNMQIFAEAQSNPEFNGMGTTVTILVESNGIINIAHVGDSRIYINTDGVLHRITKDHSFVQELVDAGQIKDEEMESHPRKNELTRALGIADTVKVEVNDTPILAKKGDKFMLCSDGLCGLVNDTNMMNILNDKKNIKAAAEELIKLAKNAGGHDNISVTILDVLDSTHTQSQFTGKSHVNKKFAKTIMGTREVKAEEIEIGFSEKMPVMMKKMMLPAIIALFVLGGGYFAWNMFDNEKDDKNKNGGNNGIKEITDNKEKEKVIVIHLTDGQSFGEGSLVMKDSINKKYGKGVYGSVKNEYIFFYDEFTKDTLAFEEARSKYYEQEKETTFTQLSYFIFKQGKYDEFLLFEEEISVLSPEEQQKEREKKEAKRIKDEEKRKVSALVKARAEHTSLAKYLEEHKENDYGFLRSYGKFKAFKQARNKFDNKLNDLDQAIENKSHDKLKQCIREAKDAKTDWENTFKKAAADKAAADKAAADKAAADKAAADQAAADQVEAEKTEETEETEEEKLKGDGYVTELYSFDNGDHNGDIANRLYEDYKEVGDVKFYLYRPKDLKSDINLKKLDEKYRLELSRYKKALSDGYTPTTDTAGDTLQKFFEKGKANHKFTLKELSFLEACGAEFYELKKLNKK